TGPRSTGMKAAAVLAFALAAAAAGSGATPGGRAEGRGGKRVLVELYTSQGCSSCPPAEALLRDLPRLGLGRDPVVPLAFHVDYWDGLGWKDRFAAAAFTARQRRYADARVLVPPEGQDGISGVYTPQMIVDGRVHFSGGRRDLALAEIARAAAR